jgi:hypothetical protein
MVFCRAQVQEKLNSNEEDDEVESGPDRLQLRRFLRDKADGGAGCSLEEKTERRGPEQ